MSRRRSTFFVLKENLVVWLRTRYPLLRSNSKRPRLIIRISCDKYLSRYECLNDWRAGFICLINAVGCINELERARDRKHYTSTIREKHRRTTENV